jgi:uncharacterized protein (DUF427 family)
LLGFTHHVQCSVEPAAWDAARCQSVKEYKDSARAFLVETSGKVTSSVQKADDFLLATSASDFVDAVQPTLESLATTATAACEIAKKYYTLAERASKTFAGEVARDATWVYGKAKDHFATAESE